MECSDVGIQPSAAKPMQARIHLKAAAGGARRKEIYDTRNGTDLFNKLAMSNNVWHSISGTYLLNGMQPSLAHLVEVLHVVGSM